MDTAALVDVWRREASFDPEGWDFSSLADRMHAESPPWDLDAWYRDGLGTAGRVLDMGTGGGEHLLTFAGSLPSDTVATEGRPPNVPVARANLTPLGIDVVEHDAEARRQMPFPDARFDLVLNRHEAFVGTEVARVLAPGGGLLTQQVGGDDFPELAILFGRPQPFSHVRLELLQRELVDAGLTVQTAREWHGATAFDDVAALVRYLRMVPWGAPDDFGVDTYRDVLLDLHGSGPAAGVPIRFTQSRFVIHAVKPG